MTTSACVCRSALIKTRNVRNKNTRRMKQTNNAIKFLMAQYRAIFKNAYFKGLTSAVLLTAGLAVAGNAQADANIIHRVDDLNQALVEDKTDRIEFDGTKYTSWISNGTNTSATNPEVINGDMVIKAGAHKIYASTTAANTDFYTYSSNDLILNKDTSYQIGDTGSKSQFNGTWNNIIVEKGSTLNVIGGSGSSTTDMASSFATGLGTVSVDNAIVNLNNQSTGNAVLRGTTINVTGKDAEVNVGATYATGKDSGYAALGWRDEVTLGDNNRPNKYTLEYGSNISFSKGATLNLNGHKGTDTNAYQTIGSQVMGKSLTVDNGHVNVKGYGAQIFTHENTFTNTNFHVASGAQLVFQPFEFRVRKDDNSGNDQSHSYSFINGTSTFDGGNFIVEGYVTAAGTVAIHDNVNFTAGNATIDTTSTEENKRNHGVLTIGLNDGFLASGSDDDVAIDTASRLEISSSQLSKFLTKTNTQTVVTDADGTEQTFADNAGVLAFGAGNVTLAFTDETQVDMHQFNWVNANMSTSGDTNTTKAGAIVTDINLVGDDKKPTSYDGLSVGVTVTATDMRIAHALGTNGAGADKITFEADRMTLGSEKGDSTVEKNWKGFDSSAAGLGVKAIIAHDELNLVDGLGSDYTLQNTVTLERDYYTRDYYTKNDSGDYTTTLNDAGRITGDNLVIGNTTTSGSMTINGGAFKNEGQTLTITSGSLTVRAVEAISTDNTPGSDTIHTTDGKDSIGWNYYKNGNPASLTWTGDFKIKGTSGKEPDINVKGASGATATLDLTGANVTWGQGDITLEGVTDDGDPYHVSATDYFAVGGEGVLTITGNQFADYLDIQTGDDTETNMTISGGGVLLVEGAVTGAINFNKFSSTTSGAGTVYFNNGGRLVSTGELSLETGIDTTGDDTVEEQSLTLGKGAIIAQGITINNRNPDAVGNDADLADNVVTVSGGALAVASRLATSNNEILFEGASLVLDSNGFTRYGLSATEGGAVSAAKLTFSGSESTFEVSTGDWTVGANGTLGDVDIIDSGNLIVGADAGEYVRNNIGASLQLDNLSLAGDRSTPGDENLIIRDGGELTVNTIQAANTSLSVEGGTLTIKGRELVAADFDSESEPESLVALGEEDGIAQAGIDLTGATINVSNQGHFILGNTAANALVKFQTEATDTADIVEVNAALDEANITLSNGSEFRLDFASGTASTINGGSGLTAKQAAMLKSKLGTFEGGSYVNVGQLALDMEYDEKTLTAQWSDIKDFVQVESDVVNSDIKQLLVQGITSSDEISGHFGAVEADVVGQNTIRVNGNLGLHKARDGYFASVVNANGQRSEVGLTLTSYSTLQLEGEGIVGTLEGQGTNSDSDVVFAEGEYFPGTTTVEGDIRAIGSITVNNDVNVTGNVTVGAAEINQALSAKNVTLEGGDNGSSLVTGTLTASEVLTVGTATQQNTLTVANGTVTTRDLVLANGSTLQVGFKAADSDDPDTDFNEAANYTGSLEAQTVDLGNGGVMVDPVNELQTAFVSFNKFKDASKAQNSMDLGTINGSLYVGNNSVLGIGSTDIASLREYVAEHQNNGALVDYGAILAVNGQATLDAGKGIVMTAQMPDDFKAYMTENKWTLDSYNTVADSVYFGDGTAMKVTAEAINSIGGQNNKNALITISGNNGQLIADGGEILISGEVRANRKYTLFTDGNGTVDVVNVDKTTAEAGEGITVSTENGFLIGEINSTTGGVLTLGVNDDSRAIMAGASDPVYTTLVAYAQGYNGTKDDDTTDGDQTDYLYDGYTTQEVVGGDGKTTTNRVKDYNYSNYFLNESVATGNGAAAESVARLAVYGGAAQAAISAGASTYDAVSGRMGVGANGANITVADNTQGAALWLAPIYKSSDSDGFDAEGLDYGVDMDLYGVALGADYTLSNGIRFGAMFNVGSGDVDGQGAGSAVSNDFDYYGFAVYGGYSMGALSVVADVSYTVADNDLEGNTAIDKVGASLDSTNLSIGVTGQYQLDFNGTTVTPHAGLRFSRIDLDDYTIDGEDVIADYDADSMNIFSIPVGVTFAKEFTGDAWTVKPSLDLTLTGNFGDDETDGTVHWAGVDNLSTNVSSEVLDNFTYGATLGVAAKTGNFSLGLGVNYTGSSNVDEFGVQANARFVF